MKNSEKRTFAVVGAGIGGLAVATGLAHDGHRVFLFDQMITPKPIGSGIVVQPIGRNVLQTLGAWDYVQKHGKIINRISGYETRTKNTVIEVSYAKDFGLGINRGALFQGLWESAIEAGVIITPDTRATKTENGYLHHSKGKEGPFDLIIDASGANSVLSPIKAKPLPYGALWTCADWVGDLPTNQLSQVYRKADKMLGILPIGRMPNDTTQKAAMFWSLPANGHQAWLSEGLDAWKEEAASYWPEFVPFLDQIQKPDDMTVARYSHGTLKTPVRDRVAFIGDAAHKTSPQLGQGANMALVDAHALRVSLRQHNIDDALRAYVLGRRWHTFLYQSFSKIFTPQYQSDSQILPLLRDKILYPISLVPPAPYILRQMVMGTLIPPTGSIHCPPEPHHQGVQ